MGRKRAELGAGAHMIKLLGLSGSLRKASYNTALLNAAAGLVESDVALEVATIHGIPLYDGDLEASEGIPSAVTELKNRIIACHGLLLATPEYNNGMPGAFKNAVDWLSRPPADMARVFANRPVAVIGASPGNFGTTLAQAHWLPVLRMLGTRPWFGGRLMVPRANQVFDASGALIDETVKKQLRDFLSGFAAFVRD